MGFISRTTAPHLLMLPDGWQRLSLERSAAEINGAIKELANRAAPKDLPRDKRPLAIEAVRRYVSDSVLDARAQGMLGVTLPIGSYMAGETMPVSMVDFEYDSSEDRDIPISLSMLKSGIHRQGHLSSAVDLSHGVKAVRALMVTDGVEVEGQTLDARSVTLLFAIPIPRHEDRWKGLQYSFVVPSRMPESADRAFISIADILIQSFRFIDAGGEEPSHLEMRIGELASRIDSRIGSGAGAPQPQEADHG